MLSLARPALFIVLMLGVMHSAAHGQTAQKQGTGIISGRVTVGEKAAPGVGVVLLSMERMPNRAAIAKAATDYEGRYRLTNVPAGRYNVVAIAPALIGPSDGTYGEPGKTITIAEGETVEKIDFTLVKGGVITGRVTDRDGTPIIGENVQLNSANKQGQNREPSVSSFNPFMYQTDDRGVYRLYGIPAGRYTISIGDAEGVGSVRFGSSGRGYYARTFHPGVTDESKATVIELGEGSEATNVDIILAGKSKSYTATGRVTDENGKPVVGVRIGNGAVVKEGKGVGATIMGAFGWGSLSDAKGGFTIDGLMPGRYAAFVWNEGDTEGYSEPVTFEITEGNVQGLELKLLRGASISGVAVIEGTTDRAALAKLSQLVIGVSMEVEGLAAPSSARVVIAPDGSFRIKGLRPGKARLHLSSYPPVPGFTLARIERDGVAQREIEITPGAQITGIRAVLEYGSGSVRGIVKIENGSLPEGAQVYVSIQRRGEVVRANRRGAQLDSRGRFLIEGLSTGEYELTLHAYIPGPTPRSIEAVKQTVTVANGVESEVTFTLDLSAKQPEGKNNE